MAPFRAPPCERCDGGGKMVRRRACPGCKLMLCRSCLGTKTVGGVRMCNRCVAARDAGGR